MRAPARQAHEFPFAEWTREIRQSTLRELLARPGLLSFALGLPAAEFFPAAGCARASQQVLETEPDALQYGVPPRRLCAHVVELMARRGVVCAESDVFLTSGAQQAMSLLGQLLVSPGNTVVTEELTYDGMLNSLRPVQPRVRTVPSHPRTGMDVDALQALLEGGERPALVYTIPEGHNPLGTSMPAAARRRVAELARRYGVPVIEDDAYGLLNYEADTPPALASYDAGWVLYVGSFSKIMAPGLRVGWVVAPPAVIERLSILKQGSDLDVSNYAQRTLLKHLEAHSIDEHLNRLRREYAVRRDAMLDALEAHFPAGARWTSPRSGMFVWVQLPDEVDTTELLRRAVEVAGVAFVPGRAFCAYGGVRGGSALRLNFSHTSPEQIHEGIRRLGGVLRMPKEISLPAYTQVSASCAAN